MPGGPLDAKVPIRRSLVALAEDLRAAREVVRELRCGPIVHDRLLAAHQSLLMAMESYTAELTARGLPVPPKLHGDLRLQRSIAGRRNPAG
jgi:hypothetical protein